MPVQKNTACRQGEIGGGIMSAPDDYTRAIRLLVDMRDRAEMAARPPGERVEYTRQDHDQHLDDMSALARLIGRMAERA